MGRPVELGREADAAFRIALARLSSAFSRRNRRSSADSSEEVPTRVPVSTSACRTHLRTVSAVPTPSSSATRLIAAHSDSCSPAISATIRTARCLSSCGYRLVESPGMTPSFPSSGVSGHAGGIQTTWSSLGACAPQGTQDTGRAGVGDDVVQLVAACVRGEVVRRRCSAWRGPSAAQVGQDGEGRPAPEG